MAADVCARRLVLEQSFSSLGMPNGLDTMAKFTDVFTKAPIDDRDALIALARDEAARAGRTLPGATAVHGAAAQLTAPS
ncbi:hypothetical protein [Streptomyces sp. NPDC048411]|uniref:hypothetical protein n=1 Tax=Streptomyces sp. NPDC048411 TaxID=3157206 RepID=UPI003455D648